MGLQQGRAHLCSPGLLILSPVMHRDTATILCHPASPSILPESLCTSRKEERKEKVKRGKKVTLVIIYYYECKVLNFWSLMSFLLS